MSASTPAFEILSELGAGTTGKVLRGVLVAPFREWPAVFEVAVKRLHPQLEQDPAALEAFRAEAEAGGSARHPALVRVLAAGRDASGPFLVMQYVPGKTLREVLESSGPLPEPLLRSVGAQVAGGLAALHAAGYTHGDVKPENVRLDAHGRAVLLDLGFARRTPRPPTPFDRAADGSATDARPGSIPYLSPEQARGQAGSPASEVFALGVVLYELATGQHPFVHGASDRPGNRKAGGGAGYSSTLPLRHAIDTTGGDALLASVATARFLPPSRVTLQLSPFLDHLLQEMLKREPAARPTAAEVETRLIEQESCAWWRGEIDFSAGSRRGIAAEPDTLHLTPLVGRRAELARLERHLAPMEAGAGGQALWLVGPAGSGKSRLMNAFAANARKSETPPLFLYGRCPPRMEGRPCGPVLRMARRYLQLPRSVAPGERESALLAELLPPAQAQTLARVLDPDFEGTTAVAAPVALADWLLALGARDPVIVFLDDVQFADDGTLALLGQLSERLHESRLFLVLGLNPDRECSHPASLEHLADRLGGSWRQTGAEEGAVSAIRLGPLDEAAVRELASRTFHPSTPRLRIAEILFARSRGNPGLLAELLRSLIANGQASPQSEEDPRLLLHVAPERMPLPASLSAALTERLRRLPPEDRLWLSRLAVVGGRIDTAFLLRAFPPIRRADADAMLARLARSGWLAAAGPRYRFARPALREAVYRAIPAQRRERLHAAAADALAPEPGQRQPLGDAFQRAFHLRAAGRCEELLRLLRPLLNAFQRRGHPQRVHTLAIWGLEALENLPPSKARSQRRIELLEAAADTADRLAARREERHWLDRLSDLELDPERDRRELIRVYLLHGRYAAGTGQFGLARGLFRNAVELTRGARGTAELRSEALRRLGAVQTHVGELVEARRLSSEALERAVDSRQRALSWLQLGTVEVLEDRIEAALRAVHQAMACLRARSDWNVPGILAAAQLLRGRIYRLAGRPRRALASLGRALRLARRAAERRLEMEAAARLGGMLLEASRPEEAEMRLRGALLVASEIEDRRGQALASLWLGVLLLERDDPEAGPVLARAENLARITGLGRIEALSLAIRARLVLVGGQNDEAERHSARAAALLDHHGGELFDRIVITGTQALVLRANTRGREASEIVKILRRRLRRENQRLTSEVLRRRHRQATTRLLESVLSPEGAIYPRVEVPWGRGPLVAPGDTLRQG